MDLKDKARRSHAECLRVSEPGDQWELLIRAVDNLPLPLDDRTIIWLYYIEGYTQAELAKRYNVSQPAICTRLKKLKYHLQILVDYDYI